MKPPKLLCSFQQTIPAGPEAVARVLFYLPVDEPLDGAALPVLLQGKPACVIRREGERYRVSFSDGHAEFLTPDEKQHTLVHEGAWWYRGVYTLEEQEGGCVLRQAVYNGAKRGRWIASLMNRGSEPGFQAAFRQLVGRIQAAL